MPEYLYRCPDRHERDMVHRMAYGTAVVCECGMLMHRAIQPVRINWNGNRAGHEPAGDIQELIRTAPARKDEFLKVKDEHTKRTAGETKRLRETDPTYGTVHRKVSGG